MKHFLIITLLFIAAKSKAAEVISLRTFQEIRHSKVLIGPSMPKLELDSMKVMVPTDKDGLTKYQVQYQGIPVADHQVVVRVNKDRQIDRLHGYIVRGIENDISTITPQISEDAAVAKARFEHEKHFPKSFTLGYSNLKSELDIWLDKNNKAHLAYFVSFFSDKIQMGAPSRPTIYVDALNGDILSYEDRLTTDGQDFSEGSGGNTLTGQYYYGYDRENFPVTKDADGNCIMDTADLMTVDMQHAEDGQGFDESHPYTFKCPANVEEPMNGAYSPINDAQGNGWATLNMYKKWFGFSPLPIKLELRVHYGTNYQNAYWNGTSMTFGDGGDQLYPLSTGLDVTAHEISHGFTEHNAALEYTGESGGMNEAFSDMAGKAAEYFVWGQNDWALGESIMKNGKSLRYMNDPTMDGRSIGNMKDMTPDLDVHYTSGVYNKAFFLLSRALTTPTAFSLFVRANQKYWTAKTGFVDGAKGVKDAAKDLGISEDEVVKAFAEVGISI